MRLLITPMGNTGTPSHMTCKALHNSWCTGGLIRSTSCTRPLRLHSLWSPGCCPDQLNLRTQFQPAYYARYFLFSWAFNGRFKPIISLPFTSNEFQPAHEPIDQQIQRKKKLHVLVTFVTAARCNCAACGNIHSSSLYFTGQGASGSLSEQWLFG